MSDPKTYKLFCGDKLIGYFYLADEMKVKLLDNIPILDIPFDFWNEYNSGQRIIGHKEVKEWIDDRVVPAGRQNIDDFLEAAGLEEYDELGLFLYADGKHWRDNFRIEEIK
ncbi:MAG: hypothetical protein IJ593_05015 [Lachnospiraceae bacterium]|nr:hypothetical protein [Lachnospiraceae bacterium]